MNPADRLADALGGELGAAVRENAGSIAELRLRSGRPARMALLGGDELCLAPVEPAELRRILNRLMENSLYAWEEELKEGYFTAAGGLRVGVCGKMNAARGGVESLSSIASVCIRVPREMRGCAEELARRTLADGPTSVLILSAPGRGKTTLLRDFVRIASARGYNVAVADERREIGACLEGVPQMDLGERTDVMDGCPKVLSVPMLVRACAPQILAVDEIGSAGDARVLREAMRCGVAVAATAHAENLEAASRRRQIGFLIREGIFDWCAILGPGVGKIREIRPLKGGGEGKVKQC